MPFRQSLSQNMSHRSCRPSPAQSNERVAQVANVTTLVCSFIPLPEPAWRLLTASTTRLVLKSSAVAGLLPQVQSFTAISARLPAQGRRLTALGTTSPTSTARMRFLPTHLNPLPALRLVQGTSVPTHVEARPTVPARVPRPARTIELLSAPGRDPLNPSYVR